MHLYVNEYRHCKNPPTPPQLFIFFINCSSKNVEPQDKTTTTDCTGPSDLNVGGQCRHWQISLWQNLEDAVMFPVFC